MLVKYSQISQELENIKTKDYCAHLDVDVC